MPVRKSKRGKVKRPTPVSPPADGVRDFVDRASPRSSPVAGFGRRLAGPMPLWLGLPAATFLLAAIAGAFYPSLYHLHRADQWWFLLDIRGHLHSWWDTFCACYSYPRMRASSNPMDTAVFRPLFFLILSFQTAFFKQRMMLWQSVGIIFHAINCLLALGAMKALMDIRVRGNGANAPARGLYAAFGYALVFFFAFSPRGMESVIWSHVNGYLVFYAAMTLAMILVLRLARQPDAASLPWGYWAALILLCLLSAFLLELGQFFAILIGLSTIGILMMTRKKLSWKTSGALLFAFLSIPLLYQAANAVDRAVHAKAVRFDPLHGGMAGGLLPWVTVQNLFRAGMDFIVRAFFPYPFPFDSRACELRVPETPMNELILHNGWGPFSLFILALGCAAAVGGLILAIRSRNVFLLGAAGVPAAMGGLHVLAVVVGRMNPNREMPEFVEAIMSHYGYFALLMFVLGVFALAWAAEVTVAHPMLKRLLRGAVLVQIVGFAVLGGLGWRTVHGINSTIAGRDKPLRQIAEKIRTFVAAHRAEPDFAIGFNKTPQPPGSVGSALAATLMVRILFSEYENVDAPKYVLDMATGDCLYAEGTGLPRVEALPFPVVSTSVVFVLVIGPYNNFYDIDDVNVPPEELHNIVAYCENRLRESPNDAQANDLYGNALDRLGRRGEAMQYFSRAAAIDNPYGHIIKGRGDILAAYKEYDRAQGYYDKLLRCVPQWCDARVAMARMSMAQNKNAEALEHCRAALGCARQSGKFDDVKEWPNLAVMLAKLGATTEALSCLDKYLGDIDPEDETARALRARVIAGAPQ